MNNSNAPMTQTARLALAVALVAGLTLIVLAARRGRASGISQSLESEDRAFEDTELGAESAAFDARIAPGAPL